MRPQEEFDTPLRNGGAAGLTDGVLIVDTTELRWFIDGGLPPDVMSCFTRGGTTGIVEERIDSYRIDRRCDMGVKRRFRTTLELKLRGSASDEIELDGGLGGRLEVWRKWSPADDLVEADRNCRWIDVHKTVVKRRFTADGDEISFADNSLVTTGVGCDVEIVAVAVAGIYAWSFAFAAYGPTATRQGSIAASWQALDVSAPLVERAAVTIGQSRGYPEWLDGVYRRTVSLPCMQPGSDSTGTDRSRNHPALT
jgi:hypothetical protein